MANTRKWVVLEDFGAKLGVLVDSDPRQLALSITDPVAFFDHASVEWESALADLGFTPNSSGDFWTSPELNFTSEKIEALLPTFDITKHIAELDFDTQIAVLKEKEPSVPAPTPQESSGDTVTLSQASELAPYNDQRGQPAKNVRTLLGKLGLTKEIYEFPDEGFHVVVKNEPFIDLVIECHKIHHPEAGDSQLILTHYYEQGGDKILDSEMVFQLTEDGHLHLTETAVQGPGREYRGLDNSYATMFSRNLNNQGFGDGYIVRDSDKDDNTPQTTPSAEESQVSTKTADDTRPEVEIFTNPRKRLWSADDVVSYWNHACEGHEGTHGEKVQEANQILMDLVSIDYEWAYEMVASFENIATEDVANEDIKMLLQSTAEFYGDAPTLDVAPAQQQPDTPTDALSDQEEDAPMSSGVSPDESTGEPLGNNIGTLEEKFEQVTKNTVGRESEILLKYHLLNASDKVLMKDMYELVIDNDLHLYSPTSSECTSVIQLLDVTLHARKVNYEREIAERVSHEPDFTNKLAEQPALYRDFARGVDLAHKYNAKFPGLRLRYEYIYDNNHFFSVREGNGISRSVPLPLASPFTVSELHKETEELGNLAKSKWRDPVTLDAVKNAVKFGVNVELWTITDEVVAEVVKEGILPKNFNKGLTDEELAFRRDVERWEAGSSQGVGSGGSARDELATERARGDSSGSTQGVTEQSREGEGNESPERTPSDKDGDVETSHPTLFTPPGSQVDKTDNTFQWRNGLTEEESQVVLARALEPSPDTLSVFAELSVSELREELYSDKKDREIIYLQGSLDVLRKYTAKKIMPSGSDKILVQRGSLFKRDPDLAILALDTNQILTKELLVEENDNFVGDFALDPKGFSPNVQIGLFRNWFHLVSEIQRCHSLTMFKREVVLKAPRLKNVEKMSIGQLRAEITSSVSKRPTLYLQSDSETLQAFTPDLAGRSKPIVFTTENVCFVGIGSLPRPDKSGLSVLALDLNKLNNDCLSMEADPRFEGIYKVVADGIPQEAVIGLYEDTESFVQNLHYSYISQQQNTAVSMTKLRKDEVARCESLYDRLHQDCATAVDTLTVAIERWDSHYNEELGIDLNDSKYDYAFPKGYKALLEHRSHLTDRYKELVERYLDRLKVPPASTSKHYQTEYLSANTLLNIERVREDALVDTPLIILDSERHFGVLPDERYIRKNHRQPVDMEYLTPSSLFDLRCAYLDKQKELEGLEEQFANGTITDSQPLHVVANQIELLSLTIEERIKEQSKNSKALFGDNKSKYEGNAPYEMPTRIYHAQLNGELAPVIPFDEIFGIAPENINAEYLKAHYKLPEIKKLARALGLKVSGTTDEVARRIEVTREFKLGFAHDPKDKDAVFALAGELSEKYTKDQLFDLCESFGLKRSEWNTKPNTVSRLLEFANSMNRSLSRFLACRYQMYTGQKEVVNKGGQINLEYFEANTEFGHFLKEVEAHNAKVANPDGSYQPSIWSAVKKEKDGDRVDNTENPTAERTNPEELDKESGTGLTGADIQTFISQHRSKKSAKNEAEPPPAPPMEEGSQEQPINLLPEMFPIKEETKQTVAGRKWLHDNVNTFDASNAFPGGENNDLLVVKAQAVLNLCEYKFEQARAKKTFHVSSIRHGKVGELTKAMQFWMGVANEAGHVYTDECAKTEKAGKKTDSELPLFEERRAFDGDGNRVERRGDAEARREVQKKLTSNMTREEAILTLLVSDVTGLPNKRALNEYSLEEGKGTDPYYIFLDVDGLKYFNDEFSHSLGDTLLQFVAEAMEKETDALFHIHGDEFVIIAETKEKAEQVALNISNTLDSEIWEFESDGEKYQLCTGVSYGISTTLDRADEIMSQHKEERQRQGLRVGRGQRPPSLRQIYPQEQAKEHDSETDQEEFARGSEDTGEDGGTEPRVVGEDGFVAGDSGVYQEASAQLSRAEMYQAIRELSREEQQGAWTGSLKKKGQTFTLFDTLYEVTTATEKTLRIKAHNGNTISLRMKGVTGYSDQSQNLFRDIEGQLSQDLLAEHNQFHDESDIFKLTAEAVQDLADRKFTQEDKPVADDTATRIIDSVRQSFRKSTHKIGQPVPIITAIDGIVGTFLVTQKEEFTGGKSPVLHLQTLAFEVTKAKTVKWTLTDATIDSDDTFTMDTWSILKGREAEEFASLFGGASLDDFRSKRSSLKTFEERFRAGESFKTVDLGRASMDEVARLVGVGLVQQDTDSFSRLKKEKVEASLTAWATDNNTPPNPNIGNIDGIGRFEDNLKTIYSKYADLVADKEPEEYAEVIRNSVLANDYEDVLDSLFQGRIVEVRNGLRGLGWAGDLHGDLAKDGIVLTCENIRSKSGVNIAGGWFNGVFDDLSQLPEGFAEKIDTTLCPHDENKDTAQSYEPDHPWYYADNQPIPLEAIPLDSLEIKEIIKEVFGKPYTHDGSDTEQYGADLDKTLSAITGPEYTDALAEYAVAFSKVSKELFGKGEDVEFDYEGVLEDGSAVNRLASLYPRVAKDKSMVAVLTAEINRVGEALNTNSKPIDAVQLETPQAPVASSDQEETNTTSTYNETHPWHYEDNPPVSLEKIPMVIPGRTLELALRMSGNVVRVKDRAKYIDRLQGALDTIGADLDESVVRYKETAENVVRDQSKRKETGISFAKQDGAIDNAMNLGLVYSHIANYRQNAKLIGMELLAVKSKLSSLDNSTEPQTPEPAQCWVIPENGGTAKFYGLGDDLDGARPVGFVTRYGGENEKCDVSFYVYDSDGQVDLTKTETVIVGATGFETAQKLLERQWQSRKVGNVSIESRLEDPSPAEPEEVADVKKELEDGLGVGAVEALEKSGKLNIVKPPQARTLFDWLESSDTKFKITEIDPSDVAVSPTNTFQVIIGGDKSTPPVRAERLALGVHVPPTLVDQTRGFTQTVDPAKSISVAGFDIVRHQLLSGKIDKPVWDAVVKEAGEIITAVELDQGRATIVEYMEGFKKTLVAEAEKLWAGHPTRDILLEMSEDVSLANFNYVSPSVRSIFVDNITLDQTANWISFDNEIQDEFMADVEALYTREFGNADQYQIASTSGSRMVEVVNELGLPVAKNLTNKEAYQFIARATGDIDFFRKQIDTSTGERFLESICEHFEDKDIALHFLQRLGVPGFKYKTDQGMGHIVFKQGYTDLDRKVFFSRDKVVHGACHGDVVYLFQGHIKKGATLKVLLHELGVHIGLKKKVGDRFQDLLTDFTKARRIDPAIESAFQAVPATTQASKVAEEALALYVEGQPKSGFVTRLFHRATEVFRKFFGDHLKIKYSPKEMVTLAHVAMDEEIHNAKTVGLSFTGTTPEVHFKKDEGTGVQPLNKVVLDALSRHDTLPLEIANRYDGVEWALSESDLQKRWGVEGQSEEELVQSGFYESRLKIVRHAFESGYPVPTNIITEYKAHDWLTTQDAPTDASKLIPNIVPVMRKLSATRTAVEEFIKQEVKSLCEHHHLTGLEVESFPLYLKAVNSHLDTVTAVFNSYSDILKASQSTTTTDTLQIANWLRTAEMLCGVDHLQKFGTSIEITEKGAVKKHPVSNIDLHEAVVGSLILTDEQQTVVRGVLGHEKVNCLVGVGLTESGVPDKYHAILTVNGNGDSLLAPGGIVIQCSGCDLTAVTQKLKDLTLDKCNALKDLQNTLPMRIDTTPTYQLRAIAHSRGVKTANELDRDGLVDAVYSSKNFATAKTVWAEKITTKAVACGVDPLDAKLYTSAISENPSGNIRVWGLLYQAGVKMEDLAEIHDVHEKYTEDNRPPGEADTRDSSLQEPTANIVTDQDLHYLRGEQWFKEKCKTFNTVAGLVEVDSSRVLMLTTPLARASAIRQVADSKINELHQAGNYYHVKEDSIVTNSSMTQDGLFWTGVRHSADKLINNETLTLTTGASRKNHFSEPQKTYLQGISFTKEQKYFFESQVSLYKTICKAERPQIANKLLTMDVAGMRQEIKGFKGDTLELAEWIHEAVRSQIIHKRIGVELFNHTVHVFPDDEAKLVEFDPSKLILTVPEIHPATPVSGAENSRDASVFNLSERLVGMGYNTEILDYLMAERLSPLKSMLEKGDIYPAELTMIGMWGCDEGLVKEGFVERVYAESVYTKVARCEDGVMPFQTFEQTTDVTEELVIEALVREGRLVKRGEFVGVIGGGIDNLPEPSVSDKERVEMIVNLIPKTDKNAPVGTGFVPPLTVNDLGKFNSKQLKENVTLDSCWPKPDLVRLKQDGADPAVILFVKKLRSSLPSSYLQTLSCKPPQYKNQPSPCAENYVTAVGLLREKFEKVKTEGELKKALGAVGCIFPVAETGNVQESHLAGQFKLAHNFQRAMMDVVGGRVEWTLKHSDVYMADVRRLLEGDTPWDEVFGLRLLAEKTKEVKPVEVENLSVADIKPAKSGEEIVDIKALFSEFGFKDLQFGDPEESGYSQIVHLTYTALCDMSKELAVEPAMLSLGGSLALSGNIGKASGDVSALYMDEINTLNVGSLASAGKLALAWSRGLDHYLGKLVTGESGVCLSDYAVQNPRELKSFTASHKDLAPVLDAFSGVMEVINYKYVPTTEQRDLVGDESPDEVNVHNSVRWSLLYVRDILSQSRLMPTAQVKVGKQIRAEIDLLLRSGATFSQTRDGRATVTKTQEATIKNHVDNKIANALSSATGKPCPRNVRTAISKNIMVAQFYTNKIMNTMGSVPTDVSSHRQRSDFKAITAKRLGKTGQDGLSSEMFARAFEGWLGNSAPEGSTFLVRLGSADHYPPQNEQKDVHIGLGAVVASFKDCATPIKQRFESLAQAPVRPPSMKLAL